MLFLSEFSKCFYQVQIDQCEKKLWQTARSLHTKELMEDRKYKKQKYPKEYGEEEIMIEGSSWTLNHCCECAGQKPEIIFPFVQISSL